MSSDKNNFLVSAVSLELWDYLYNRRMSYYIAQAYDLLLLIPEWSPKLRKFWTMNCLWSGVEKLTLLINPKIQKHFNQDN